MRSLLRRCVVLSVPSVPPSARRIPSLLIKPACASVCAREQGHGSRMTSLRTVYNTTHHNSLRTAYNTTHHNSLRTVRALGRNSGTGVRETSVWCRRSCGILVLPSHFWAFSLLGLLISVPTSFSAY